MTFFTYGMFEEKVQKYIPNYEEELKRYKPIVYFVGLSDEEI